MGRPTDYLVSVFIKNYRIKLIFLMLIKMDSRLRNASPHPAKMFDVPI